MNSLWNNVQKETELGIRMLFTPDLPARELFPLDSPSFRRLEAELNSELA